MGRTPTKPRVTELDPHLAALAFVRECVDYFAGAAGMLEPLCSVAEASEEALCKTDLYRRIRRVADYAVCGTRPRASVASLVAPLEQFAASPLWERVDIDRVVSSVDPQHGDDAVIKLLLVAAFARERLDAGDAVTTTDLAVLAGVTRTTVVNAINQGALTAQEQGRVGGRHAYVVSARHARAWLSERRVSGFMVDRPARSDRTAR
jgi:hypothetical protein